MSIEDNKLKNILEAALMAVGKPMTIEQMMKLFTDEERPSASRLKEVLAQLQADCEGRGIELKDIASGYRYQARQEYSEWMSRLWEEKAPKYSRAYLETLALIAYRQPVTRAEIEDVRGVSVSSNIVKTMLEREWIRVVGHRDVPGRPSLYATTKQFLDYFNMKSLEELPSLAEIKDLEDLSPELGLTEPGQENVEDTEVKAETDSDVAVKISQPDADDNPVDVDSDVESNATEDALDSDELTGEETPESLDMIAGEGDPEALAEVVAAFESGMLAEKAADEEEAKTPGMGEETVDGSVFEESAFEQAEEDTSANDTAIAEDYGVAVEPTTEVDTQDSGVETSEQPGTAKDEP